MAGQHINSVIKQGSSRLAILCKALCQHRQSLSVFPTVQMHNRHNNDPARAFLKQDTEGKRLGKAPADIKLDDLIQVGIQNDAIDCVLDRSQKPFTKATLLFFIVCRRR